MNPKKNNHEVTRAYLEQWRGTNAAGGGVGLNWINLQKIPGGGSAELNFEPFIEKKGKLKAEADFAVKHYLYVPLVKGERNDDLENEFSVYEDQMIHLCRDDVDDLENLDSNKLKDAILGCLTHSFRDSYGWFRLHNGKQLDQEIAKEDSASFEAATHHDLVNNAGAFISQYKSLIKKWNWKVFTNLPVALLTSERPCFDMRMRAGEKYSKIGMPLSPRRMLMGAPPDAEFPPGTISIIDVSAQSPSLWHTWNKFTVERARQWIVATDEEQLLVRLESFSPENYQMRVETEKRVIAVDFISAKNHSDS